METDLKEAVSSLKKEEYERALRLAHGAMNLRVIELQVMTDSRLSQEHRIRLLKRVEGALHGPSLRVQSEHSGLRTKTAEAQLESTSFSERQRLS
jgi:hypothetical protein